jgi:hypothetical protein
MKYDHHCIPPEKKIKKVPVNESQNLFLVKSINKRNVLIRKKQILKFQEKAKALSTSMIKYDQVAGRSTEVISFTGSPQISGAFRSPIDSFFRGRP